MAVSNAKSSYGHRLFKRKDRSHMLVRVYKLIFQGMNKWKAQQYHTNIFHFFCEQALIKFRDKFTLQLLPLKNDHRTKYDYNIFDTYLSTLNFIFYIEFQKPT